MYFAKREQPLPLQLPYVLSPSGTFDGNDGKWSTFIINIGDDGSGRGQNFKVLISTSSPLTQVPQQTAWCTTDDCARSRGIMLFDGSQSLGFNSAKSLQWKDTGKYTIPLPRWWPTADGLTVNGSANPAAVWGVGSVGLGESSLQSDILINQYVVEYTVADFFMGSFGLAVGATGPLHADKPTFIDNFYGSAHKIASRSYGYTAGAFYRNNKNGVLGNLVLGGYDKSRLTAQGTSIAMPNEKNTTLAVGVQSILYAPKQSVGSISQSFTSRGFSAVIDSTLPYLILPDDICDQFVLNFRLGFDKDTKLFTVNESSHNFNVQQDAKVSFKIGAGPQDSTDFASIVLPYAAFDQQSNYPLTNETTPYFPIKRSENGMFVLGRTFLQEAYIIVDYERSNFTVAPALFSEPMPDQSLVTIFNKTYTVIQPPSNSGGGLSSGAIAGIVVGIVVAFVIAGIGAFLVWKRRLDTKKKATEDIKTTEIDTMFAGNEVKYRRISELTGSEAPQSPKDSTVGYYTADHKSIPPISELSPESTPAELYSPPPESRDTFDDYFIAGGMRRRGATSNRDSSDNNTTHTPIAELPGEDIPHLVPVQQKDAVKYLHRPRHSRNPSNASLSTNIAEVLAGKQAQVPKVGTEKLKPSLEPGGPPTAEELVTATSEAQSEDAQHEDFSNVERRPSHTRDLSDTTIQSNSTALSQPTPEELDRWAKNVDNEPARPMSP
ncbi:acid protease [Clathrospora elynae]|uniref:Acid protease n=1 Tax=Clathrospora elynae TaxID=706981 RepID=A0A6A5SXX5_9PLEO|nr:acid protease [Clathrospora elynae]